MRRDDTPKPNTSKTEKPGIERRNLLKGLGIGAAGVAAATLANTTAPAEAATESRQDQLKSRYQDNAHVERFYALNRL
ncbi:twin-arginine translocation signal domain-containing protein [Azospirillum canadense]|uniref:twin-arginine translocation signal domain-containing protein n=1 Tax=Azospirillum canadense TaxID=403962 RepID=UPI002225C683|nr:twin-arginine translocation signal domain-containing protein [Azospirillum canadense]MCW2244244.1 hypothetical protein [Azospirillum canadense]